MKELPVVQPALSELKKTTRSAISSTLPSLFIEAFPSSMVRVSLSRLLSSRGVEMYPGPIALQRIFRSEERRVGKEWRCGGGACRCKKGEEGGGERDRQTVR